MIPNQLLHALYVQAVGICAPDTVRVLDSEHFLQHALKRHDNWEIHPVLKMEYCAEGDTCDENSGNWKDLEAD